MAHPIGLYSLRMGSAFACLFISRLAEVCAGLLHFAFIGSHSN